LYFENLLQTHSLENLVVEPPVSLPEFSAALSRADICLDLRENNSEYSASLPIKIFYYIASGKPVIYTRLQALDNYMKVSEFGKLVNPEEAKTIADFILEYIDNPHLYNQHAQNARKNYEEKYNWGVIKYSFLEIIE
jgi:glycosyltransferase involved in cell wall biosynthesis